MLPRLPTAVWIKTPEGVPRFSDRTAPGEPAAEGAGVYVKVGVGSRATVGLVVHERALGSCKSGMEVCACVKEREPA